MSLIAGVPADPVPGPAAEWYAADVADLGYVANRTRLLARRPEVLAAWRRLEAAVRDGMDRRRYELAGFAAANALRSTYGAMAHGRSLRDRCYDSETVRRLAADPAAADLAPADAAVVDFADRVARDATSVGAEEVARLRDLGMSDVDILDLALAVAATCFLCTVLDAAGAPADAALSAGFEPALRAALTVGRAPEPRAGA